MDCTEAYRDYNCASLSYVSEPRLKIFPVSEYEPLCGVFLSAISVKDFLRCLWGGFCLLRSCISCRCFSTLCFSGGLRCSLLAADFLRLWYSHSARSLLPFPQPHLAVLPVKGNSIATVFRYFLSVVLDVLFIVYLPQILFHKEHRASLARKCSFYLTAFSAAPL